MYCQNGYYFYEPQYKKRGHWFHRNLHVRALSACNEPVGVTSGTVQDFQLTASTLTVTGSGHHPPWRARYNAASNGQELAFQLPSGASHWVQVSLTGCSASHCVQVTNTLDPTKRNI